MILQGDPAELSFPNSHLNSGLGLSGFSSFLCLFLGNALVMCVGSTANWLSCGLASLQVLPTV